MRDAPRLHLETPLEAGIPVALDAERAHYLLHVMRAGAGDPVRLFNAAGGEWQARITEAGKRLVAATPETRLRPPSPPDPAAPILVFALLKRDATDLVVRMATELGAAALRPVLTARTVAPHVNLERLRAIAREAAEQCERLDVPAIDAPVKLTALLGAWRADTPLAVAIERAAAPALGGNGAASARAVLIGPEGGFTQAELDLLRAQPFVHPVSLGALVLRADTAAAAALALLRAERLGLE